MPETTRAIVRQSIDVRGVVQGVGFRPFVHLLATQHCLAGFVRNSAGRVDIEVEGAELEVASFLGELRAKAPPLARIEEITCRARAVQGDQSFRIEKSDDGQTAGDVVIAADVATCDACLRELFDPTDRRFRYPFINCTACGPRLTIVTGAPYDRSKTTMASFAMCPACRAEYDDPRDRRFHAQPIACAECGPLLRAVDAHGATLALDALGFAAKTLTAGRILAVKGLGGYHLACSAEDAAAVIELRRRKGRDEQPLAVMVRDLAAAAQLCHLSDEERHLLESEARPIVLSVRRTDADLADGVAPGQARLGVMLPYTPIHHCLLRDMARGALVMTSGNPHAEPMAFRDADALERLGGIADAFIVHDRPIHARCDDSVAVVLGGGRPVRTHVRRSRGFAPLPLRLPFEVATPTLAVGGHMKATFALATGRRAFVSHHLGDLDDLLAFEAYRAALAHYEELFRMRPRRVVHDAHPDYASTREAFVRADGAVLVAVRHHHAHLASCMADQGLTGPVIGVCFDGSGLGDDGTLWGGEFLVGGYAGVRRAGHLAGVGMPGGDRASREGWRMAVAHLRSAGIDPARGPFGARIGRSRIGAISDLLESDTRCPRTSSIGRLFDAVASITGACDRSTFEGQAAMALEAVATREPGDGAYPYDVRREDGRWVVDPAPLIRQVCADVDLAASGVAWRFHETLGRMVADVCSRIRDEEQVNDVALTGGVFVNAALSRSATLHLEGAGFRVHRHERVPPNDGGLCLGQIAIAAALDPRGGA